MNGLAVDNSFEQELTKLSGHTMEMIPGVPNGLLMQSSVSSKQNHKRGRKPNNALPPSRSRDIQRAFRARKAQHLASLESKVQQLESENMKLRQAFGLVDAQEYAHFLHYEHNGMYNVASNYHGLSGNIGSLNDTHQFESAYPESASSFSPSTLASSATSLSSNPNSDFGPNIYEPSKMSSAGIGSVNGNFSPASNVTAAASMVPPQQRPMSENSQHNPAMASRLTRPAVERLNMESEGRSDSSQFVPPAIDPSLGNDATASHNSALMGRFGYNRSPPSTADAGQPSALLNARLQSNGFDRVSSAARIASQVGPSNPALPESAPREMTSTNYFQDRSTYENIYTRSIPPFGDSAFPHAEQNFYNLHHGNVAYSADGFREQNVYSPSPIMVAHQY